MRKFHSMAALCGDSLRPELQELFHRLAIRSSHRAIYSSRRHDPVWPRPRLRGRDVVHIRPKNSPPDLCRRVTLTDATEVSFW